MLDSEKLIEWSDEAARSEDFVIAQLLLYMATLKNLSDERTVEILRNLARIRATEAVAACRVQEVNETLADKWDEVIDG